MAVVANSVVTVQKPKLWTASIGNGDASLWKLLKDNPVSNLGASADGAKITGIWAASTDTSARDVQLAAVRTATVTVTIASPGVFTLNNHNLVAGDQVFFSTTGALPTGLTAGTTYWVISAGLTANAFEVSTSAGGTAVNTSVSQSGVHTIYIVRILTTISVPATAGTVSTVPSAYFFNPSYWPGYSTDNDGNPYLDLEGTSETGAGQDYLAVSCAATVTANKIINVSAQGGFFNA